MNAYCLLNQSVTLTGHELVRIVLQQVQLQHVRLNPVLDGSRGHYVRLALQLQGGRGQSVLYFHGAGRVRDGEARGQRVFVVGWVTNARGNSSKLRRI